MPTSAETSYTWHMERQGLSEVLRVCHRDFPDGSNLDHSISSLHGISKVPSANAVGNFEEI
jgi:hypothetical protein